MTITDQPRFDLPRAPIIKPDFRAAAIAWAQGIAYHPDVVYLDTETTGLGPDAEIVDIAIVASDGTVLLDTLVRPVKPIPAESTKVHGISDDLVDGAPTWSGIYADVALLLLNRTVCIYNAQYDARIIRQVCAAAKLPEIPIRDQCAMLAYSDFDGTPGKYGDRKWHKLEVAARHFGIEPGTHRALTDALACRSIVRAMAGIAEEPNEPEIIDDSERLSEDECDYLEYQAARFDNNLGQPRSRPE